MTDKHWHECWRYASHHACAVAEVERLRGALERDKKVGMEEEQDLLYQGMTLSGQEIVDLRVRVEELESALQKILDELGVPWSDYPAPVANAYDIAKNALAGVDVVETASRGALGEEGES